ncbi:TPA: CD1107 family mobile element protein [Streptococcus agalactiae]
MKKLLSNKKILASILALLVLVGLVATVYLNKSNIVYAMGADNNHGQYKTKFIVNMIDNTSDQNISKSYYEDKLKFKINILKEFKLEGNLTSFDRYDEMFTEADFDTERTGNTRFTSKKEFNYYKASDVNIGSGIFLDFTENNQDYYVGSIEEHIRTYSDNKIYHILDTPVYKLNRDIVKTKIDYDGEIKEESKKEIIKKVKEANPNINNLKEIKIEKDKLIIETWNRYHTGLPYITFNVDDLITRVASVDTQTDKTEKKDSSVQTDDKSKKDSATQTKAEVKVKYFFEDGKVYKEFTKTFDVGYVLDASELDMLPDNMKFLDDFATYKVKGKDDEIIRKVSYLKKDENIQTEEKKKKDVSVQTVLTGKDIENLEKDLKAYEKEMDKLNKELKDKADISNDKKEEINKLNDKIKSLEEKLENRKNEKIKGISDKEISKLEDRIKGLESKIDTLKNTSSSTGNAPSKTVTSNSIPFTSGKGTQTGSKKQITSNSATKKGNTTSENTGKKEEKQEIRYPNKLTPKQPQNSQGNSGTTGSSTGTSTTTNTNKGVASSPSKARASVTENVDNANNKYPIHHNDGEDNKSTDMYSADARQFITFTTKNGKTFHLIINHDEDSENVMLLTEVSEDDLLNMVEKKEAPKQEITKEEPQKEESKPVKKEESSNTGTYLILILVVAGALGAGYYFKVVKKKENEELEALEDADDDFFSEADESENEVDEVETEDKEDDELE